MAMSKAGRKAVGARMKAYWAKKRAEKEAARQECVADDEQSFYGASISELLQDDSAKVPGYESLDYVLRRAYFQAAAGKGKERHAQDLPFTSQPMQTISSLIGTHNGMLYQAIKKVQESNRLPHDMAINELLGAINYIAGAVIYLEMQNAEVKPA